MLTCVCELLELFLFVFGVFVLYFCLYTFFPLLKFSISLYPSLLAPASNLGYGRSGAVQDHHTELLQRVTRGGSGLQHQQRRELQPRATVDR